MIKETKIDIFDTNSMILVNTVNCVGISGKGLALEFKKRYPEMYNSYRQVCLAGKLQPGQLHIWKGVGLGKYGSTITIINFPTKRHWRDRSRLEDIEAGLVTLRTQLGLYPRTITASIPALGCRNGGLDWKVVKPLIIKHLEGLEVEFLLHPPKEP